MSELYTFLRALMFWNRKKKGQREWISSPIWNPLMLSFLFLFLQQIKSHFFTVITLDSWGHVAQSVTTHHQVSRCIQRRRKSQKDEKRGRARPAGGNTATSLSWCFSASTIIFLLPCPLQKQGGMYSGFKGCGVGCNKTGLGVKTDPLRSNAALMCV